MGGRADLAAALKADRDDAPAEVLAQAPQRVVRALMWCGPDKRVISAWRWTETGDVEPDGVIVSGTDLSATTIFQARPDAADASGVGQIGGQTVQSHPVMSVRIMEGMAFLDQEIPAVRYHHERFDGGGYPEGLCGSAIPLPARILSVADAFDAMTSTRVYRGGKSVTEAVAELRRGAGAQFDPTVVQAFLDALEAEGITDEQLQAAPADSA